MLHALVSLLSLLPVLPVDNAAFCALSSLPASTAHAIECQDGVDCDDEGMDDTEYQYGPNECCLSMSPVGPTNPGLCVKVTICRAGATIQWVPCTGTYSWCGTCPYTGCVN